MCFAMQEPTPNSEDTIDGGNPAPDTSQNTANEEVEGQSSPAAEVEVEAVEEEQEIDPWEALELEAAKWKDQAVRTAAELDNFRKRMTREKLDAVRYGNQSLLEELLPVLDNFNMGMQAAAQEQGSMLYMGMDMVNKQLGEFLSSQNVTEIATEDGGEFDPNVHEALSQEVSEDIEEGKIIRVVRKGYRIGERLLRPANVIVALGEESQPESE
jgi:molecular chaperone GrpE